MKNILLFVLTLLTAATYAAVGTTITESTESVLTYAFSDPTPVAVLAPQSNRPCYPYNHFDGYTTKGKQQEWQVVTLENPYIKVTMLPQMGGKIWGAIEKESGREFIYQNHVMKFRDIAMRGAWTSGGIEFNFGILGHVPTTATPIDYITVKKPNGSASCYVASYEWITQTWWQVEVNLPKDKAYFTTSVTWYNASANYQSCYQWMNAAYTIRGNAEFVYPGNASIGHDGLWDTYPVTKEEKDISWYKDVNFGSDVSVHVLGHYSDFYGIYWHDWDFGSAHMAKHGDKLGAKYFIWSKARSGAIWEELLTDEDGQYIEQQSGRMFCQPVDHTVTTPFKHTALQPCVTEKWTEYWFPIKDIHGLKQTARIGSLNVERENGKLHLLFSPLAQLRTQVRIYDNQTLINTLPLQTQVLKVWEQSIDVPASLLEQGTLRVVIGDGDLVYSEVPQDIETNRPLEMPRDFNWDDAYGQFTLGENLANQKRWKDAIEHLQQSLSLNPYFLPAINMLARIYNQRGQYEEALQLCLTGLSVSTYDAECNYEYAIASLGMHQFTHAKDGFSMATRDASLSSAANQYLAQLAIQEGNYSLAKEYACASLRTNSQNLGTQMLQVYILRKQGLQQEAERLLMSCIKRVPLYPQVRYEQYRLAKISQSEFLQSIQCELPDEVFIELGNIYAAMGAYEEAEELYGFASHHPIAAYCRAYIYHLQNKEEQALSYLNQAQNSSPHCVFPFRPASLPVLQWAEMVQPAWQNRYYLALVYFGTQQSEKALDLLLTCDEATYAPLFLTRATLQSGEKKLSSLLKSQKLEKSWRCGQALLQYYLDNEQYDKALNIGKTYHKLFPNNYYVGTLYAKALCKSEHYQECFRLLESLVVLPYEGSTEGHDIYRDAYLGYAEQLLAKGKYQAALDAVAKARLWPENLGAGKPYDNLIDSSREDALETKIRQTMNP